MAPEVRPPHTHTAQRAHVFADDLQSGAFSQVSSGFRGAGEQQAAEVFSSSSRNPTTSSHCTARPPVCVCVCSQQQQNFL